MTTGAEYVETVLAGRAGTPTAVADPASQFGREYVHAVDDLATSLLRKAPRPRRSYTNKDRREYAGPMPAMRPNQTLLRGGNRPPIGGVDRPYVVARSKVKRARRTGLLDMPTGPIVSRGKRA